MDDDTRINLLVETVNALEAERDKLREALEDITAGLDESRDTMPLIRGKEVRAARAALAKGKSDE
jgi:hypothetical protein